MISVIIPAYNASKLIGETIRSVAGQSYSDIEIIVVDDGSTDKTSSVVQEIKDDRLRIFRQKNSGQSAAANRGAREAQGEYIKFVDADDLLNPRHLETQLSALANQPNQLACCSWGYFVDDPRTVRRRPMSTDRNYEDPIHWILDSMEYDGGMMGGWSWLIPRSVWNKCGGWNEQLSLNNDFDFSIRLALCAEGVRYSPEALYCYRKGVSGSLSGSYGAKAMQSAWLTTELGTRALLARSDDARTRRLCANRFQDWLFHFYPEYPALVSKAETRIRELGGSNQQMLGGIALNAVQKLLGWKIARHLQVLSRKVGWNKIIRLKQLSRIKSIQTNTH